MRTLRTNLITGTAMLGALPRSRRVAGAAIYLGAALEICRLFL